MLLIVGYLCRGLVAVNCCIAVLPFLFFAFCVLRFAVVIFSCVSVLQSNKGEIEMCHAMSSFSTVIIYVDVDVVWTICYDLVVTVVVR